MPDVKSSMPYSQPPNPTLDQVAITPANSTTGFLTEHCTIQPDRLITKRSNKAIALLWVDLIRNSLDRITPNDQNMREIIKL